MIFMKLPPSELKKCLLICRQWNCDILENNMLMKKMWSCVTAQKCIQEAEKGNTEFFLALTEFATDPNPADVTGWTPLHEAAQEGELEVCRIILERCEDQNPADDNGMTPMHWAASGGHLEMCRLLLERCEDPNSIDARGWTPLHEAAQSRGRYGSVSPHTGEM